MDHASSSPPPRLPFSVAVDRWIDFCVWVLEADGLQVPPFNRHGPGNGSLQALGLDAAGWIAWLRTVVVQQGRREALGNAPMFRAIEAWEAGREPEPAAFTEAEREEVRALDQLTPALLWTGDRAMVEALSELWWRYSRLGTRGQNALRPVGLPPFQERIAPSASRLSGLRVLCVDYPGVVAYAVPPDTVLLAVHGSSLPGSVYDEAVLSAIPHLLEPDTQANVPVRPSNAPQPHGPRVPTPPASETHTTRPNTHLEEPMSTDERGEPRGDASERLALRLLALSYETSMRGIGTDADELAPPRLFPAQLPDTLPVALPLPDEPDLLGSFTMGTHVMVLLETALSPFQTRDFYRARLLDAGWWEPSTVAGRQTGFEVRDGFTVPDVYCRGEHGPSLHLQIRPGRELRTEVSLLLDTAVDSPHSPCSQERRERDTRAAARATAEEQGPIPALLPPDTARLFHDGTGGHGNRHMSHARLHTDLDLPAIMRHYDGQLQRAGWAPQGRGRAGGVGWSVWNFQSKGRAEGYGLFWVVQDKTKPDHYALTVEAIEQPSP